MSAHLIVRERAKVKRWRFRYSLATRKVPVVCQAVSCLGEIDGDGAAMYPQIRAFISMSYESP